MPDRLLKADHVEFHGGIADHRLEVLADVGVEFALVIGQPFVDEVFEELEPPMANPNLDNPQPLKPRQ